jgi:hypothetical protein
MRKGIVSIVSVLGTLALPMLANAQGVGIVSTTPQQGVIGLIQFANTALNDVMVLLITAAIVSLFYAIVRYIFSSAGGEAKAGYLNIIMYSVIAIFVMVSIWGIIHLLQATFGVNNSNSAETPAQIQIGS